MQGPRSEKKVMKTRVIGFTALPALLAILVSLAAPNAQAGDTKPLKGWEYSTVREYPVPVPDDPYFNAIVEAMGPPLQVVDATGVHFNNAVGMGEDHFVELDYLIYNSEAEKYVVQFYIKGRVTAPNGDTLNYLIEGVVHLGTDPELFTYTGVITGGTGRFEGAQGAVEGQGISEWPYLHSYEGFITTVGSMMRDK